MTAAIRRDAWTVNEDEIVYKHVMLHLKKGNKMKDAFEELEEIFDNRTPAAIRFRWNKILSKKYREDTASAKSEGIKKKKKENKVYNEKSVSYEMPNNSNASNDDLIPKLNDFIDQLVSRRHSELVEENKQLKAANKEMSVKLNSYEEIQGLIKQFSQMC